MFALGTSACAKILKTSRPGEFKELALTIGSGFEFETDCDRTVYDFRFLGEYGATKSLKLRPEPNLVLIHSKDGGSLGGFGDLETRATLEVIKERR